MPNSHDSLLYDKELAYEASLTRGERPITFTPETTREQLDVVLANDVVDRGAIEQKAMQLIRDFNPETKELRPLEAKDNARTAIFEALTASGHMSRVELEGEHSLVHEQVITRLLNGYYRPHILEHERKRVFQEICEELTNDEVYFQISVGCLPPDTKVTTVSDYASGLGSEANKHGYRSANKKGMIRETSFEFNKFGVPVRIIEQISRSNAEAIVTIDALENLGINVTRHQEADVDLLGTQLLGAKVGALEIMKRLDSHAGMAVMYGEFKRSDTVAYEDLESTSLMREQRVESFIDELAQTETLLDKQMARGEITQTMWNTLYGKKLQQIVRSVCIMDPSYVHDALGDKVLDAYERAHQAYLGGDSSSAAGIVSGVSSMETSIVVCGMEVNSQVTDNSAESSKTEIQRMLEKSKWEWNDGHCREALCEFNKRITKVGPCSVCITCQAIYDNGKEPSDVYRTALKEAALKEARALSMQSLDIKETESPHSLEKVETIVTFGGATVLYRDKKTGVVGTKEDFALTA